MNLSKSSIIRRANCNLMNTLPSFWKRLSWIGLVLVLGGLGGLAGIGYVQSLPRKVSNFQECVTAGYPISGEDPQICSANHNSYPESAAGKAASTAGDTDLKLGVPFEILVSGDSRGVYPHVQEIISTEAEWEAYWKKVHASLPSLPPLIPVDFSKKIVAAVSEGPRQTEGYGLSIIAVQSTATSTVVAVHELIPSESCKLTKKLSNTYSIVAFDRPSTPISFSVNSLVRECVNGQ